MTVSMCRACDHPSASHARDGACRLSGCACPGFDDGTAEERAPRMRRVCVDVPDGYAVMFSLIPTDGSPPEGV